MPKDSDTIEGERRRDAASAIRSRIQLHMAGTEAWHGTGSMQGHRYDYVIDGAGTAGCLIANRLPADRDVKANSPTPMIARKAAAMIHEDRRAATAR